MYCQRCHCQYVGWTKKCPICHTQLTDLPAPVPQKVEPIAYDELLSRVRANGGRLTLNWETTQVTRKKGRTFPYFGHGYAWAASLAGSQDGLDVQLETAQTGKDKACGFPYRGYGFAWAAEMAGHVSGNELRLSATEVVSERKWRFPYDGFGYAWTETMSGTCGDRLTVELRTTEVGRSRATGFPYRGYGFAWAAEGTLTLALREAS